jgi:hypothetical protein
VSGVVYGQSTSETTIAAKPRVYALIAAIGEQFTVVYEVSTTGTHLSPYRRRTSEVSDNVLNRFALNSLDDAIVKIDPAGKRIYMTLPAAQMDGVEPSKREDVAIGRIIAALEKTPERAEWDRIVVATPAYRALQRDGMPSKLQGFGLFFQPLCQAGCPGGFSLIPRDLPSEPPDGVEAITSENKNIKARTFLAPFAYIAVSVLDPKTLAILDRQERFDNQKLAEPRYKPSLDYSQSDAQRYLMWRIASLIDMSIGEAVVHSEVNARRGKVEFGDVREVEPDNKK